MTLSVVPGNEHSPIVNQRLAELETVIEQGLETFVEVGKALREIHDSRLYKERFPRFDEYCKRRWGIRKSRAYQLMGSSRVVRNLSTIVDKTPPPATEAQARELGRLGSPTVQQGVWEKTMAAAPEGKVTAKQVKAFVDPLARIQDPELEKEVWGMAVKTGTCQQL